MFGQDGVTVLDTTGQQVMADSDPETQDINKVRPMTALACRLQKVSRHDVGKGNLR